MAKYANDSEEILIEENTLSNFSEDEQKTILKFAKNLRKIVKDDGANWITVEKDGFVSFNIS